MTAMLLGLRRVGGHRVGVHHGDRRRLDPSTIRAAFSQVGHGAAPGHWHSHELRHTSVSILSASGARLEDVVGHTPGSRMTGDVSRHQIRPSVGVAKHAMQRCVRGPLAPRLAPMGLRMKARMGLRSPHQGKRVEVMGLEPTNLLTASQALYQLSYTPVPVQGTLVPSDRNPTSLQLATLHRSRSVRLVQDSRATGSLGKPRPSLPASIRAPTAPRASELVWKLLSR